MILLQNNIDRQILLKYLSEGICQVSFTKVKDNTNRVLLCTLHASTVPAKFLKSIEMVLNPVEDEDLVAVWDVTDGKWKSFRISKVNSFKTPDELTKNDKSGPDVDTAQKMEIVKRSKAAKDKLFETIQKQKEAAQKAKEKLNKVKGNKNEDQA